MSQPHVVVNGANRLGEVPLWSPSRKLLYWIDVRQPALYCHNPASGHVRTIALPETVGSYCETSQGRLLLALKSGLHFLDPESESLTPWMSLEPHLPNNRLNDGKCDRQGRFWVGSMNDGDRIPSGTLYAVSGRSTLSAHLSGITIPNALAWSPDGRRMYFSDTFTRKVLVYDFDVDDGVPHNPRIFRDMTEQEGRPDGATVDALGCLWVAEIHAGRVVRYTPEGRLDRTVALPVSGVTSCAFGGDRYETLYMTTATQGLTESQRMQQPLAGALFAVDVGICGVPETVFAEQIQQPTTQR